MNTKVQRPIKASSYVAEFVAHSGLERLIKVNHPIHKLNRSTTLSFI